MSIRVIARLLSSILNCLATAVSHYITKLTKYFIATRPFQLSQNRERIHDATLSTSHRGQRTARLSSHEVTSMTVDRLHEQLKARKLSTTANIKKLVT